MTETEEDGEEGMRRPASMAAFAEEMKWGQGMAIWVVGKRIEKVVEVAAVGDSVLGEWD